MYKYHFCDKNTMSCIQNKYRKYIVIIICPCVMYRKMFRSIFFKRSKGSLHLDTNDNNIPASILFVYWLKDLYFCVFTLVLNTDFWAFSATASSIWVTTVALATWCNAQILLDGLCFRFAKLKRFCRTGKTKNLIFGVWIFCVCTCVCYVESSIWICCFIKVHHHIWYLFSFFMPSVERPLDLVTDFLM